MSVLGQVFVSIGVLLLALAIGSMVSAVLSDLGHNPRNRR